MFGKTTGKEIVPALRARCSHSARCRSQQADAKLRARVPALCALVIASASAACGPSSQDLYSGPLPDSVDFNFHVKPILSDRCFACHGPDEGARKADLRLHTREGVRAVVSPGSLRRSELFRQLLEYNARDLVHGSYGLEGDHVVLTDTLELENLDFSEFEASFDSITLALASHLAALAPYRER